MEWKREIRECPICEAVEFKTIGTRGGTSHRDGIGEETTVVQCRRCTALYARPSLIPLGNPYESDDGYFAAHDPDDAMASGHKMMSEAEEWLPSKGKVLEIGCGRGLFLIAARCRGWEVAGIEMTERFAAEARERGIDVEVARAETCEALNGKYDVILMPAILEHLYRPIDILKRVAGALNPGGLLFVDTPNECSLAYAVGNLYVRPWSINLSPTFAPYHVVGFSPKSLRVALNSVGLRVKKMDVVRYPNALPGGGIKRGVERAVMGAVQRVGSAIGRGDGLIVWAKKPNLR